MGGKINSQYDEAAGDITPDGLYMTFGSNNDLKWVSSGFIEMLKHTNFVPYLKTQIPNQTDTIDRFYSYTFPDSTFIDDDGNSTLVYSAKLSNGNSLPSWLSFNPGTRTFSGTPAAIGSYSIKVTATDTANAEAVCIFTLDVIQQISVKRINEIVPSEYKLFRITRIRLIRIQALHLTCQRLPL